MKLFRLVSSICTRKQLESGEKLGRNVLGLPLQSSEKKSNLFYPNKIKYCKGAFNNYVDRILPFFDTSPPARTVFIPWAWTKTDTFWTPPPSSCPRSYWMPPTTNLNFSLYYELCKTCNLVKFENDYKIIFGVSLIRSLD